METRNPGAAPTANSTDELLKYLQELSQGRTGRMRDSMAKRDAAAGAMRGAMSQPVNRRLANPGQSAGDTFGIGPEGRQSQTGNQNRALLQTGLAMMGGAPGEKPGAQFSRGIQSGFGLLDELREGDRTRGIETASTDYTMARDSIADEVSLAKTTADLTAPSSATYGTTERYIDEDGNMYFSSMRRQGGEETTSWVPISPNAPAQPKGRVQPLGNRGMTAQQRIDEASKAEFQKILRADSARNAQAAYQQFGQVRGSLDPINQAIEAIDSGAQTGPVEDLFPSFRASTVLLENAMRRMGLDVVGATTFGALSKGELDLALSINRPPSMEEMPLREFLVQKRTAVVALMNELNSAARFFEGGGLPSEYISTLEEQGRFEGPDPERNREVEDFIKVFSAEE